MNHEGVSPKETGFLCVWVGQVKVRHAREGSHVSRNSGNKHSGGNLYPIFQGRELELQISLAEAQHSDLTGEGDEGPKNHDMLQDNLVKFQTQPPFETVFLPGSIFPTEKLQHM